ALAFLYCFLCSSDPVSASIHFAAMSILSFGGGSGGRGGAELIDPLGDEGPGVPELGELLLAPSVQGVHLARGSLLTGDLLDVDETLLLDAYEECIDGALGDLDEAPLAQL